MKVRLLFVVLLVVTGFTSGAVFCQTKPKVAVQGDRLPPLSRPTDCGLAMRYIDDALKRAFSDNSTIIMIVRTKNVRNAGLARSRSNNLRNYIRFRGFKRYEVVVDLDTNEPDQVDIFVRGEPLYTLPINRNDRLSFLNC